MFDFFRMNKLGWFGLEVPEHMTTNLCHRNTTGLLAGHDKAEQVAVKR
jgi:hypothetical protein